MTSNRRSTSRSVSDAVGSSMITIARVGADRLGDLDDLLLRHAQRLDEAVGIDRGADPLEQLRGAPASRPSNRCRARRAPVSSASAMFSATVRSGKSAGCW